MSDCPYATGNKPECVLSQRVRQLEDELTAHEEWKGIAIAEIQRLEKLALKRKPGRPRKDATANV